MTRIIEGQLAIPDVVIAVVKENGHATTGVTTMLRDEMSQALDLGARGAAERILQERAHVVSAHDLLAVVIQPTRVDVVEEVRQQFGGVDVLRQTLAAAPAIDPEGIGAGEC